MHNNNKVVAQQQMFLARFFESQAFKFDIFGQRE